MSVLPVMEKLLEGVEVEWKALGDVASYIRGLVYNKSNESPDGQGYKVLRANNINLPEMTLNFNDVKVVSFDTKVKDILKLKKNDILISAASGSREHVGKVAFIHDDIDFYFGGFMGVVRCGNAVTPRFLFHVLISDIFQKYLDEMLNSSTINNLNSKVMGQFLIPIPPLNVQAEIVRILDAFTAYTAELTAELNARKKQYNHYRDQLLSFDEGVIPRADAESSRPCDYAQGDTKQVEWKTLGEITTGVASGRNKVRASNGPFTVYGSTGPIGFCEHAEYSGEMLLVARVGAYAGQVNFVSGEFDVSDNTLVVRPSSEWNVRFAYHQLTNMNLNKYAVGAGQPLVTGGLLKSLKVPVPPFDEQVRIASILDKFDALTASISEGLPREIELRQKQYEYYRDRLLSFPKPASDSVA